MDDILRQNNELGTKLMTLDHTLEDPHSKVKMIEIEFKRLMFDVRNV